MTGGGAPQLPDPQPDIANLSQRELSSNQEAKVVPWFCGERKMAANWIGPPYNLYSKKLKAPPGPVQGFFDAVGIAPPSIGAYLLNKQADSSRATAVYYFGSLAAVLCAGPIDEFVYLLMNGGTIWPTNKSWADSVIEIPVATYKRVSNTGRLSFQNPHGLKKGDLFVLSGMDVPAFDCAGATAVIHENSLHIRYANVGADVAETTATSGFLTKVVPYEVGNLIRDGASIWECVLDHDGLPSRRPPNGTYWSSYSVLRSGSSNPFAFSVDQIGEGALYWGTTGQTLDPAVEKILTLNGHPPGRHEVVIVLDKWLFGSSRTAAPNIEAMMRRAPAQSIIVGDAAELIDGQANPLACVAELLTDPIYGIGRAAGTADATSWQAVADALKDNADRTYVSPVLDKAVTFRAFVAQMMAYYDGWLRFNAAGKIVAGRFLHDEAPPAFDDSTTIDFNDLVGEIEWSASAWPGTFNECTVRFEDRARAFKGAAMKAVSGINREIVGEPRGATVEAQWITRELQASQYAAEWLKLKSQPQIKGNTLTVRAEKAAGILAGSLFLLTHDALGVSFICRCIERRRAIPPAGRVTIRFENERGTAAVPYRATPVAPGGTRLPRAGGVYLYQFVQLPPSLASDQDFCLGVLAARTSELSHGVRLWFKKEDSDLFMELGAQTFFAVNGSLAQDYPAPTSFATEGRERSFGIAILHITAHGLSGGMHISVSGVGGAGYDTDDAVVLPYGPDYVGYANAGANEAATVDTGGTVTVLNDDESETLQINLAEFTLQADLDRISETQTEDAINDNALLLWLFDADDPTVFEIATVKSIRIELGVYKLKVRRARFFTSRRAFTAADTICWIGFRRDLFPYAHQRFSELAQSALEATFRLQSFTTYEEADIGDAEVCPDIAFTFADPYAPVVEWTALQKNGVDIADLTVTFAPTDLFTFSFKITDRNGDFSEGRLVARLGSEERTIWAQSFSASSQQLVTTSFKITTDGIWRIFCVAKDFSGRSKEYELTAVGGGGAQTLKIVTAGSTTVATPVASPGGGVSFGNSFHVTLTDATAGSTIKYQVVTYGSALGAWTTYAGAVTIGASYSGRTLYAYALKAGLTDSAVLRWDFWRESNL